MNAIIYAGLPEQDKHYFRNDIKENDPDRIIDRTCNILRVKIADIKGATRVKKVAEARMIAIALIDMSGDMTLKKLGAMFGGRHHSTVIYARNLFADLYGRDKQFTEKVNKVKVYL